MRRVHDVFICHASEDKDEVARPLAQALASLGLLVWFDEFSIRLGDSMREAIDRGLSSSRFGIVILSSTFFEKPWAVLELNALFSQEAAGETRILPVWHNVDVDAVRSASPLLVDKRAIATSGGLDKVAEAIQRRLRIGSYVQPDEYTYHLADRILGVPDLPVVQYDIKSALFERCTIHGPVVFIVTGNDFKMFNCSIETSAIFWRLEYGRPYIGGIGVEHVAFVDCHFDNVGIAGGPDVIDRLIEIHERGIADDSTTGRHRAVSDVAGGSPT